MIDGWQVTEFENVLAEPLRNGIYKTVEFHGRGIGIVNMGDLFAYDVISGQQLKRVELNDSEQSRFLLQDGDLLFARRSLVLEGSGKCSIVIGNKEPLTFESSLIRARINTTIAYSPFYFQVFHSPIGAKLLQSIAAQNAVSGIRGSDLISLRVPLPPLDEQRKIAAILSTWDEAIGLVEQLTAALGRRKQALMQLLLTGAVRFAGFEGEWEKLELDAVVLPKEGIRRGPFGGALKKEIFTASGYKVYEQKNVIQGNLDLGSYFINEERFKELASFSVKAQDLLVSCSGTIGKIISLPDDAPQGVINQALLRIRLNKEIIDQEFFLQQFRSEIVQQLIIENTQGGAMPNLVGMDIFRQVPLNVPSLGEQIQIADVLKTSDEAIELLTSQCGQLQEQKRGLMQQLLTGQVRV